MAKTVLGDRKPVFKVEEKKTNNNPSVSAEPSQLPLHKGAVSGGEDGMPKATGIGARERFEIESKVEKRRQELVAAHKTELDKKRREERTNKNIQNRRRGFNYVPTATQKAEKRRNELIGASAEYRKNNVKPDERKGFVYTPSASTFGGVTYNRNFEVSKMADDFINTNSPFGEYRITSKTGSRDTGINGASKNHAGLDRDVPEGTAVSLPMDTTFRAAGYDNARGYWIEVTDKSGNILHYQHLRDYGTFKPGQMISAGTPIARSGSTGVGTAHLHEEYYTPDGRNITESYWAKYANQTPESIENWKKTRKQISEVAVVGDEKENTVISKADNATKYLMEKATAGFERVGYEYISFLDKLEKKLERADNSWIIKGDDFTKGIRGIISSGARKGIIKFLDSEGFENLLEKSKRDYQEYTNDAQMTLEGFESEAAKTVLSGAGMVAEQAARLVPTAIIGTLTGGAGLAPKMIAGKGIVSKAGAFLGNILSKPMFWNSYIQQSGAAYADAKEYGATEEEAQAASDVIGFVNAMIENIGGIESVFGEKVAPSVIGRFIKELTKTAVQEGVEEGSQDIVENLVNKLVYKEDAPIFSMTDEDAVINPLRTGKEVLAGAVMGGIFYGTNAAFSSALSYATDGENLSDNIKNMSPEELQAVKQAVSNIQKKAESGAFDGLSKAELDADSDVQVIRDAVKFSVAPDFETNYDKWVNEGRPDRKSITVGRTSEALNSIGVKEQRITWDTTKINKALKKHSYLNDGILKQIPQLIDEPVIVMQSKSIDSRITMLGEVYDGDGLPVMAVLELLPLKDKSGVVLDEIKVVSTHSRKTSNPSNISQTQNVISTSRILYVEPNRKRTDSWLMRTGLQLPVGITNYGSINNISYPEENVNDFVSLSGGGTKYTQEGRVLGETQRKFFEAFGLQVEMDESLDANAKILLDEGKVIVSPYAVINDWEIVRHEFTHQLKILVPEAYELYTRLARQEIGGKWDEYYKEAENDYAGYYARRGKNTEVTPELIEEEVYARYAEGLDNNAFIEKVANENATLGAKIRNLLKRIIGRIKSMFSRGELKGNTDSIKKIISAKDAWENAVIEAAKKKGKGFENNSAAVRYSESSDTSIKDQLTENAEMLDKMDVIAKVNSNTLFANSKSALEWAVVALKNSGYKAERRGFGTIIFDEKRLKNGLRYMKDNTDYLAYALIPKVVKQGIVIDKHANHKNRGYDTYTFAGPVEINGKIGNMAVVVRSEGKNYYKLHKVVFPDGGMISYNKESSAERAAATNNVVDMPTDTTSINIISRERQSVNKEFMKSSEDRVRQLESENEKLNIDGYTQKEIENWRNSKSIEVYESDEQLSRFISEVISGKDLHKKIYFGKISEATANFVLEKTGVDILGYNISLKGYEIRKILLNSHGNQETEEKRGQVQITAGDLKNVPYIIANPDNVTLSKKQYEGKPVLMFHKNIAGQNFVVAYASKKHHDIAVQTMYKKRSLATAENADALSFTSETTNSTASNNIIAEDKKIVNKVLEDMRNSRETTPEREAQYRDIPLSKNDARYKADTRMVRADYQLVERVFKDGRRVVIHDFHRYTGDDLNGTEGYNDLIIRTTGGEYNAKRMPISYRMKNLRRTMREFFGDEGYEVVKNGLIYPMEDSKLRWQALLEDYTDVMKDVTDRLGIKKGSKLSAALMYYGEWVRPGNLGDMPVDDPEFNRAKKAYEELSESEKARIAEADEIIRTKIYDPALEEVNETKRQIYGDIDKYEKMETELNELKEEIDEIFVAVTNGDYSKTRFGEKYEGKYELMLKDAKNKKELAETIRHNSRLAVAEIDRQIVEKNHIIAGKKRKDTKVVSDARDSIARLEERKKRLELYADERSRKAEAAAQKLADKYELEVSDFRERMIRHLSDLVWRADKLQNILKKDTYNAAMPIKRRNNYYHHMAEQRGIGADFYQYVKDNGWGGSMIETMEKFQEHRANEYSQMIQNGLVGKSADTKPKSKWQSAWQKRTGQKTTYDAVGNTLNYIRQAAYSTAIDPNITMWRRFADDLSAGVDGEAEGQASKLGEFVGHINDVADVFAGKSSGLFNRDLKDKTIGRDNYNLINKNINRVKYCMLAGNIRTSIIQLANLPAAMSDVIEKPSDVQYFAGAWFDTVRWFFNNDVVSIAKRSSFLTERYSDFFSQFETGKSVPLKKLFDIMLTLPDEVATRFTWNAAYRKFVAEGHPTPIRAADEMISNAVGNRNLGEKATIFNSGVFNAVFPFVLESMNDVDHTVDKVRMVVKFKEPKKTRAALFSVVVMFVLRYLVEEVFEKTTGSESGSFNPLGVIIDWYKDGGGPMDLAGELAGNWLGATLLGQSFAETYDAIRNACLGDAFPSAEKLFGSENPSRYGTSNLLISALKNNPLQHFTDNPILLCASAIALAYTPASNQIKKTANAAVALYKGAVTNNKGEELYTIDNTDIWNVVKGLIVGKSGFKETPDYYDAKDSKGIYEKYLLRKPGMRKTMQQTELERLIGIDESIKPSKPGMSFEFNDVEYKPGRYYETYEKMYGRRASQYYNKVMLTDEYKAANDELKIVMVKNAFKNALKDAKAAYVLWAKSGFPKDGGSFEQSFESEFIGKKIVGNGDAAHTYTAEGFTKGKGYAEIESGGQTYILQGDAYNVYEKARYDEFAGKMNKLSSRSITIKNEGETDYEIKNNIKKMTAIIKQLLLSGEIEALDAKKILVDYLSGKEAVVPASVEFAVGNKQGVKKKFSELNQEQSISKVKSLANNIKSGKVTIEEAKKTILGWKSGEILIEVEEYITGDFNSLTAEQQEKVIESINKGAKEKALGAVEDRLN